ncbi:hypothetical protein PISMIDRAFT_679593, partial [Pisolithus microcarpus 441]
MSDRQPDPSTAPTEPIVSPAIAAARPTTSSSSTIDPTPTPVTIDKGKRREKSS